MTRRRNNNHSRSTERTEARADSNFERHNDGYQGSAFSLIEPNKFGTDSIVRRNR